MSDKIILFDFDGTLLYTIPDLGDAVNFGLSKFGYATHDYDTIQSYVGNGVRKLVERALPGGEKNPDFEGVFAAFNEYYDIHCVDKTCPYEGIMEMLEVLHKKGLPMAIVTNKYQEAAEELRERFFGKYIPIIEGDRPGRERKPNPAPVLAAMKALGAEGKRAVYIGDSEVDYMTAANSGTDFIAVAWGYRSVEMLKGLGAEKIAMKPMDIPELI